MDRRFSRSKWTLVTAFALIIGCSDAEKSSNKQPAMKYSSGRYNQGYKDGQRDAKMSLFDDHAGWMWLWMMENEYKDGYHRGWADGRSMVKLEKEQKESSPPDTRNEQAPPED